MRMPNLLSTLKQITLRRMIRTLTAVTVVLLATAATASAEPPSYRGQATADLPEFRLMVDVGIDFWAHRGVAITLPVELLVADDVGDAEDGLGETPYAGTVRARAISARDYGVNRLVFRRDWIDEMRAEMSTRHDLFDRRASAAHVCALLWHELGHIGGLAQPQIIDGRWVDTHPAEGLMSEQLTTPSECIGLARRGIPKPRWWRARRAHRLSRHRARQQVRRALRHAR